MATEQKRSVFTPIQKKGNAKKGSNYCTSKWASEVSQSCPTLCDPMDCSLSGSSVHGIFQARVLEWMPFPSPGIFQTQEPNPGLLHCRQTLYCLSHQGSQNYCTVALNSQDSKAVLKILQARLQQHMNREDSDAQVGFRKSRGNRDRIANIF